VPVFQLDMLIGRLVVADRVGVGEFVLFHRRNRHLYSGSW
jgi:hypothetical protein